VDNLALLVEGAQGDTLGVDVEPNVIHRDLRGKSRSEPAGPNSTIPLDGGFLHDFTPAKIRGIA
jgi:hypothetical protein